MTDTFLSKFYEADNVSAASGDPLVPGSAYIDYSLTGGNTWTLNKFGGSASIDQTEIELLYSEDNGATFTNPYDSNTTKIRCIHMSNGNGSFLDLDGIEFYGGTNRILRIKVKNYNTANAAEIAVWLTGFIKS